jgi:hypothetical protein
MFTEVTSTETVNIGTNRELLIEQRNEGRMNNDFRKSQIQSLELVAFFFLLLRD